MSDETTATETEAAAAAAAAAAGEQQGGASETQTAPQAAAAPAAPDASGDAPQIDWDDIGVLQEAAQRLHQLGYQLVPAHADAPQPEPAPEPELDPFDPESVRRYVESQVEQRVQSVIAQVQPVSEYVAQLQSEAAESIVDEHVALAIDAAELSPEGVDTPDRLHDLVKAVGNHLAAQKLASQHGPLSPLQQQQLGQQAIADAVALLKSYREAAAQNAVEEYRRSLTEGGGNLLDLPVRGAGVEAPREYKDELAVARAYVGG